MKLLHESTGHIVTVELTTGAIYRGKLLDAEDSMNVQLKDITVTHRDGRIQQLDQVFIRGSSVRLFIVPDMLKNAPMFKNIGPGGVSRGRGVGAGRGRATVLRANGILCVLLVTYSFFCSPTRVKAHLGPILRMTFLNCMPCCFLIK